MPTSFVLKKWSIVALCLFSIIDLIYDSTAYLDRITDIDIDYEYPHVSPKELANIKVR